jgi:pimeloyl-ACP methyl ester carboxylesterase
VARAKGLVGVAAAVAGGAAAGFLAERLLVHRRIAPSPDRVPLGSLAGELGTIDGPDGTRIAVETYGSAGAPQLLLSHGWVCTGRVWHEQVAGLADRYRLVTYEHPGHGRSTPPASGHYDLDLLGDTLCRVVEEACEPGPVVVAGHSMGGMALLNAVRRHGSRLDERLAGAVLLSTTSHARPARRLAFDSGIQGFARLDRAVRRLTPRLRDPRLVALSDRATSATSDLSHLVTRWMATGPGSPPEVADLTQQLVLDNCTDVILGLAQAVLGVDEDAGLDRLAALGVPTAIVVGSHDRLTPVTLSEQMAARSHGELVLLDGVGHMAPLEASAEINAVLRRYLDRAAAKGAAA